MSALLGQEQARAKINLGLKVLCRRQDGYHNISSIMQTVDLADQLHFFSAAENRLTTDDPQLSTGPDNLVWRALALFARHCPHKPPPLHIHLEKRIPAGAGLGGGSADAAATLRALNNLADRPFSQTQLKDMAALLGSDIPFLVEGGTALASGRGEVLQPLDWRGAVYYVLVCPPVHISTVWAYKQLGRSEKGLTVASDYLKFISSLDTSGGLVLAEGLFSVLENDFEALVKRVKPIVAEQLVQLTSTGAKACSMSGTGSAIYGIFDDRNTAYRAHQGLKAKGCRSFFCHPVPQPLEGTP